MLSNKILTNYFLHRQFGGEEKVWNTLEHNGVLFPPEYVKHNVPVIYQTKEIILDKDAEEAATFYAKYLESDNTKNKIFNSNFWRDWKKLLGPNHEIKKLEDCNFRPIYDHILRVKEAKKSQPKEEVNVDQYQYVTVDGVKQKIKNFRIEPPGIFLGRGCHPKFGSIKRRIYPEDITLNLGKTAPIPPTLPGHQWGKIVNNQAVSWIASWHDPIGGKVKYVWLDISRDNEKYDRARELKKKIKKIRQENNKNLVSEDIFIRQLATVMYFIDNFALRVGNQKREDEADTVGVTTLRKEHIELMSNNVIKLDFLGKDSVRYQNKVKVSDEVYRNIAEFMENEKSDQLFHLVTSNDVNKYLQKFMPDLTAKVFRTFNASNLFQEELHKIDKEMGSYQQADKINVLLDMFNKANAKVALLCNHQKNVNKSTNEQLEKINKQIKEFKKKLKELDGKKAEAMKAKIKMLKSKKILKTELKNLALGTSKINYIDPRISVAFIKRHKIPIEKIFSKTLLDKITWAMETDENYEF